MFSGIVEELGIVKRIYRKETTLLEIQANKVLEETEVGDSIAVDGVCLTVIKKNQKSLFFEVTPHTLKNTTLSLLKINQKVNLERSLKYGERLCGHFVLGHIDCIGIIIKRGFKEGNIYFEVAVPKEFIPYCVPKSSISLDGISLTLAEVRVSSFLVYITDYTLKNTNLYFKNSSSKVNIEFDILVKSVQKYLKNKDLQF